MQEMGSPFPGRTTDDKRWLVCGGRDFGCLDLQGRRDHPLWPAREAERNFTVGTIERLAYERSGWFNPDDNWIPADIVIISGAARGVDTNAVEWAVVNWCGFVEFPAQWNKYGKSAGYKRNAQMLVEGKPDLVIAFPGGKGTAMMVKLAKEAGVETIVVPYKTSE